MGPSLNWTATPLPPPYKLFDFDILKQITLMIVLGLKYICKYQLFDQDVYHSVVRVAGAKAYPINMQLVDALNQYLSPELMEKFTVSHPLPPSLN